VHASPGGRTRFVDVARRRAKDLLRDHRAAYDAAAVAQMVARYAARLPHDPDFRLFRRLDAPVLFVDVGANRGQSVLSFRAMAPRGARIVSFEANPENGRYLGAIRRLLGPRFEYHLCGLGEATATEEFFVPVRGRRRVTGEGSFSAASVAAASSRIGSGYEVATHSFSIRRFDSFGIVPDIVKIDVQGDELRVLKGMGDDVLQDHQPLLMIEANPARDGAIADHLGARGYRRFQRSDADLLRPPSADSPLNWFYAGPTTESRLPTLFEAPGP
jgi:FkbM family methyltransferase